MERKDFFNCYKEADSNKKLEIMLSHYKKFPQLIHMVERRLQRTIKAEVEYQRGQARADLGVRVQTSGLSDTTFSEAVTNIEIEKIVLLGETIDIGCLKKSGVVETLEREIRAINRMKEDYEDLTDVINGLDDTEEQLLMEYFVENKCIQELADERQLSYKGIYKQLNLVRNKVKVEMMKSFEIYSREVSA